jgi:hypothetical protein
MYVKPKPLLCPLIQQELYGDMMNKMYCLVTAVGGEEFSMEELQIRM